MTSTKHTPGPWRFERSSDTARCIGTIRSVPGNHWLATIDSFDGAVNNEANAQLMAAAPSMFDCLLFVRHWFRDNELEEEYHGICDHLDEEIAAVFFGKEAA